MGEQKSEGEIDSSGGSIKINLTKEKGENLKKNFHSHTHGYQKESYEQTYADKNSGRSDEKNQIKKTQ